MTEIDEPQLIELAKTDADAFKHLYQRYIHRIHSYVLFRIGHKEEAEDITSIVWEKVVQHFPQFTPEHSNSFAAWIFAIAHNCVAMHYRSNSNKKTISTEDLLVEIPDPNKTPYEATSDTILKDQLAKAIKLLPEQQAVTVSLRFFSELSNKEIAQILQLSEKTVASNLCRGLRQLYAIWNKDAVNSS